MLAESGWIVQDKNKIDFKNSFNKFKIFS